MWGFFIDYCGKKLYNFNIEINRLYYKTALKNLNYLL